MWFCRGSSDFKCSRSPARLRGEDRLSRKPSPTLKGSVLTNHFRVETRSFTPQANQATAAGAPTGTFETRLTANRRTGLAKARHPREPSVAQTVRFRTIRFPPRFPSFCALYRKYGDLFPLRIMLSTNALVGFLGKRTWHGPEFTCFFLSASA